MRRILRGLLLDPKAPDVEKQPPVERFRMFDVVPHAPEGAHQLAHHSNNGLHLDPAPQNLDVVAFERAELARIGMPDAVAMRHRTPHFQHIFSGESYSAGYYSYLWSEVLDADGFEAFQESGDIFDSGVAQRLHDFVYAAGGSRDYEAAYQAFRGRPPAPQALLRKRGLEAEPMV